MAKPTKVVGSGTGESEQAEAVFHAAAEDAREHRKQNGRYPKPDIEKMRRIHFLVTQMFNYLGVPWVPAYVPPAHAPFQSGYTYSPMRSEQGAGLAGAVGAVNPVAVPGAASAWTGPAIYASGFAPEPLFIAPLQGWNLVRGVPGPGGRV